MSDATAVPAVRAVPKRALDSAPIPVDPILPIHFTPFGNTCDIAVDIMFDAPIVPPVSAESPADAAVLAPVPNSDVSESTAPQPMLRKPLIKSAPFLCVRCLRRRW